MDLVEGMQRKPQATNKSTKNQLKQIQSSNERIFNSRSNGNTEKEMSLTLEEHQSQTLAKNSKY